MTEKQKTAQSEDSTTFDEAASAAIELTRSSPEPIYDEQVPEWLNDRSFITASARAAHDSIVEPVAPKPERAQSPEASKGKKVLKAVGVGVGITAVAAGAVGFGELVLDAADHQVTHNEEVGREALQQQDDFQKQLDNGVVYVNPAPKAPSNK